MGTFKHLCLHSITKILRNGPKAHFPHPNKSMMRTTRPLKLLHMDSFGPTSYTSIGRNKYCFVLMDDFSRFTWVSLLKDKLLRVKSSTFSTHL